MMLGRPLRLEDLGGWSDVTGLGNGREAIFSNDENQLHFLEVMAVIVRRFCLRLPCFALMDNYVHLLLGLREHARTGIAIFARER